MKRKMRELLVVVMLVVMAAALSITLISCGSSEKSDSDPGKAETQTETVIEEDDSGSDEDAEDKSKTGKSSSNKSDSESKDKSSGSSKAKPAKDNDNDSGKATEPTQPATQPTTKAPDVCYITIEGYCSGKAITLEGGDTVYSVLCRSGASVSGSGHYVKGINGKFEFDEGPTSGWTYYVNGSKPGVGCGSYSVKAGDNIKWDYVTSY